MLARVRLSENNLPENQQKQKQKQSEEEEDSLFQAITQRRSNRMTFQQNKVQEPLLHSLKGIANDYQAWLDIIVEEQEKDHDSGKKKTEDKKNAIADLISEGDRIQWADKRFRCELASWIHSNRSQSRDGMPGYSHGISDIPSVMASFTIRTFDNGKGQAAKDRQLASGSPVLGILGTDKDDPISWLQTGQALAKILLRARAEDVWTSFLNQPIEVEELRTKLRDLLARSIGFPQILMRMGYGQGIKPTPRRTVDEVVH